MAELTTKLIKAIAYLLSGIEQAATESTQQSFDEAGRICEDNWARNLADRLTKIKQKRQQQQDDSDSAAGAPGSF